VPRRILRGSSTVDDALCHATPNKHASDLFGHFRPYTPGNTACGVSGTRHAMLSYAARSTSWTMSCVSRRLPTTSIQRSQTCAHCTAMLRSSKASAITLTASTRPPRLRHTACRYSGTTAYPCLGAALRPPLVTIPARVRGSVGWAYTHAHTLAHTSQTRTCTHTQGFSEADKELVTIEAESGSCVLLERSPRGIFPARRGRRGDTVYRTPS
jgi:hypothetical protein